MWISVRTWLDLDLSQSYLDEASEIHVSHVLKGGAPWFWGPSTRSLPLVPDPTDRPVTLEPPARKTLGQGCHDRDALFPGHAPSELCVALQEVDEDGQLTDNVGYTVD